MATIRIPAGFVRGESLAIIPGRFSRGSLIRWQDGSLIPVGGWNRITGTPLASVPRWGTVWKDDKFDRYMGIICDANVYVETGSTYKDITPDGWINAEAAQTARGFGSGKFGLANFGRDDDPRGGIIGDPNADSDRIRTAYPVAFSAEKWGSGEFLFGSSADGRVWVYKPGDTAPSLCPGAPIFLQGFIVTDERHLMCFGGVIGTDDPMPNRVWWSDQGNREGWNFADVEGQAGYFDLQDAGLIYCARKIPGGYLIFTQTSVWVCRYIGSPNFYGFQKLAESVAPVSPQAVVVGSNRAFWWGQGKSFWKYESGVVAQVTCTLGLDPFENVDAYYAPRRVTGAYNGTYPEIWWFYPSKGQNVSPPVNDRYVIYNVNDGWWADGYLERSFMIASPIDNYPVAGSVNRNLYAHEQGWLDEGKTRVGRMWAEVDTLSFEDGDRLYSVTQMQPDTGGAARNVRFEFDCRYARGGPTIVTEKFECREDGYCDARFTARDFTMRVIGMVDAPWAVGGLNFYTKARGRR